MRPKADPDHLPPMESNHHMHYDKEIEDLKKAVYYINRKIKNLEK